MPPSKPQYTSRLAALRQSLGSGKPATSTTPSKPSAPPRPNTPVVLLDVPFTARPIASSLGAVWDASLSSWKWERGPLPPGLEPFRSRPYSYERLREHEVNGTSPPASPQTKNIVPRPHQTEATRLIVQAKRRGRKGFLLGDEVGLGKTISAWKAILEMPEVKTVLIVAPLAVLEHWRQTIGGMGDGGKAIVVLNYDRLQKLVDLSDIKAGKKPSTLKGKARMGTAREFDVVVWDECHRLKNPDAARTKFSVKINAKSDFMLWLSATAGIDPLDISYLSPLLAQITGSKVSDLKEFEQWCKTQNLGVSRQKFGKWVWDGNPEDIKRTERMLFGGTLPGALRRRPQEIAGWPELNRILLPVELTGDDAALYEAAWTEFRQELGLEGRARDAKSALVARLRFRQKSSLLRIPGSVDHALSLLENGHQVAISVAFRETLATLVEILEKAGHPCAQIHGDLPPLEKERQRMLFQRGDVRVVLFTPTEGISLHQGEHNDVPRSMMIHDLRWSAIDMGQVEGRCHRDGKFAQVYWMLAPGTIDTAIAETVVGRIKSMKAMVGDNTNTMDAIEQALVALSAV